MAPRGRLTYLYVGTDDTRRDLRWYVDVMGAEEVWSHAAFGARVAAVRLWERGPLLLLADHRPKGSVLPVYAVASLDEEEALLRTRGWAPAGPRFGIPDGDCYLFHDPAGNELAMYEDTRPGGLERA
jgi:catechol 2,3-dioxygenase-like lactoylglutathione lyase family enzyme